MSMFDYLRAMARNWWLIIGLAVLGAGAGYLLSSATPNMYRSTSSVLLTSDQGSSTSELVQGSAYVQNLVATYVLLVDSEIVLKPVIDDLGLDTTPQSLASAVTASSPLGTVIIEISATSSSPERARQIASGVTSSLTRVVTNEVSPTTANGTPTVRLTTIQSATLPRFAFEPNTRLDLLIGLLAGLVLGVAFSVVRTLAWNTVRSAKDVSEVSVAPAVGEIVAARKGATLPGSVRADPLSIEAESVRSLAANLSFLRPGQSLKSFVVTSASPAEGKSSLVTSLGLMLAESGKRVLLVDADLRNPSLAEFAQIEGSVGLTNVLIDEHTLEEARQPWSLPNLHILTAGSVPPNPGQVLSSDAMRQFIRDSSSSYDMIIVDSAPILSVTDAKWLGNMTDGAIVVARYERTTTRALRKVMSTMEAAGVDMLGVVITRLPRRKRQRYGGADYGVENRPNGEGA